MAQIRPSLTIFAIGAILFVACITGCNSSATSDVQASPYTNAIGGSGSTFVDPLIRRWVVGFQQVHPKILINYRAIGSGGGITELKQRVTDFAASDAPLNDDQLKDMPAIIQVPVSAGPVCIIYNLPSLQSSLRLSGKTLADIYGGKIVTWNDPAIARDNPGVNLPRASILVVHRGDGSGTTSILTTYLSKVSPDWSQTTSSGLSVQWPVGLAAKGSTGVIDVVKHSEGTIGYVELNYAKQEDLTVASIQNRAGTYVEPSVDGATAALDAFTKEIAEDVRTPIVDPPPSVKGAYPISGVSFVLIPRDGPSQLDRQTVKDFVEYAISDGQSAMDGLYYAKLPKLLQDKDEKLLSQMMAGGQPLK